jgi:hypothetical protein
VHELILPQGIVEIIFNFSGTANGVMPHARAVMQAPRCFIQGLNTYVIEVMYVGTHHLFGVRHHPHLVHALLGILPAEAKDTTVDKWAGKSAGWRPANGSCCPKACITACTTKPAGR